MAEFIQLERGWSLYHMHGKGYDLMDPEGENRATFLMEPATLEVNMWTAGFEAGVRNGIIEGRKVQAERVSIAVRKLLDGYTGDVT